MKKGILIVISGPSGAGKGTVVSELIKNGNAEVSVSCTTRNPRKGEIDGINYFFKTEEEFKSMIYNDAFLEYAQVFGNYYGTPKEYVETKLNSGINIILEIDVQGAKQIKKNFPGAVLIFILPPSLKELYNRLKGRGTETEDAVNKRFSLAKSEINQAGFYDYIVVNNSYEVAADDINTIIKACSFSVSNDCTVEKLLSEEGVF